MNNRRQTTKATPASGSRKPRSPRTPALSNPANQMTAKERLFSAVGGQERFSHLKTVYKNARPKRGRWGPCILTADEVFRRNAKEDGFSEEGIALFIENVDLDG